MVNIVPFYTRFLTEPRELPLGKMAAPELDAVHGLPQGTRSLNVVRQFAVSNGLPRGSAEGARLVKSLHLTEEPGGHHGVDTGVDALVKEWAGGREPDLQDTGEAFRSEGGGLDPGREGATRQQADFQGADDSDLVFRHDPRRRWGIEALENSI
jgi:hypothetical protein